MRSKGRAIEIKNNISDNGPNRFYHPFPLVFKMQFFLNENDLIFRRHIILSHIEIAKPNQPLMDF